MTEEKVKKGEELLKKLSILKTKGKDGRRERKSFV